MKHEERAEGLLAVGSGARITTAHRELPLGSFSSGRDRFCLNPSPPRRLSSPDSVSQPQNARRIQGLRESPRRPGRYVLQLGDGRTFVVGVAVLSDTGATKVGVELSEEQVARLAEESTITDLMDRALDALARSRRTRRELELRLLKREATPAQVRTALDRLEASGVLSDETVARAEAGARLRRGDAPARVRQQLRRKGVDQRTVTEAVSEALEEASADGFDEVAACRTVAEKRARSLRAVAPDVAERRLLGFLLRRGYAGGLARRIAREVLQARP